jgi:hypothetical protein
MQFLFQRKPRIYEIPRLHSQGEKYPECHRLQWFVLRIPHLQEGEVARIQFDVSTEGKDISTRNYINEYGNIAGEKSEIRGGQR